MAVMQVTAMNLTDETTPLPSWNTTDLDNSEWTPADDIQGTAVWWNGGFLPPPPRPFFLLAAQEDGPTTCDLCTWAWSEGKEGRVLQVDVAKEVSDEFGWVLTLIIVSIISATIGAAVMITVLHCRRRMKPSDPTDSHQSTSSPSCGFPSRDKTKPPYHTPTRSIFSWLTSRGATSNLSSPPIPVQNHYTHMNSAYSLTDDAAYAELDTPITHARLNSGFSISDVTEHAYCEADAPSVSYEGQLDSSCPSSAYYSDLSITGQPDRTYEVIGGHGYWDYQEGRLGVITETLPSDYV